MFVLSMILMCSNIHAAVIPIRSIDELQLIGNDQRYPLYAEYSLMQDIDASSTRNWNSGAGFKPIGTKDNPFVGKFNGNGYKIHGLFISRLSQSYVGLFGYISQGGGVTNLGIEECWIEGKDYVGSLVGVNYVKVFNCHCSGSVEGNGIDVGGLVGYNEGAIYDSYNSCYVKGSSYIGGVVGYNYNGTISRSYNKGSIIGKENVGGLVGFNNGAISDSYNQGSVSGSSYSYSVGGLVGNQYYYRGTIANSYSVGSVSGSFYVGGLVGKNEGKVWNSYWDMQTSGCEESAGGIGKMTEDMKHQATYEGWNFTNIWTIIEGQTYPYLLPANPSNDGGQVPPPNEGSYEYDGEYGYDGEVGYDETGESGDDENASEGGGIFGCFAGKNIPFSEKFIKYLVDYIFIGLLISLLSAMKRQN